MSGAGFLASLPGSIIKINRIVHLTNKLLNVNFSYGKDAWIELKEMPGATFKVRGDFFDPKNLVSKSQPAKFVLLVKALLEAEGKSIKSASVPELAKRFGVSQFSLCKGLREIGQNAIE